MNDDRMSTSGARILNRRQMLRAALAGAAGVAGSALLAACGGSTSPTATSAPATSAAPTATTAARPTTAAPAASATTGATTAPAAPTTAPAATTSAGTASSGAGTVAASPVSVAVNGKFPSTGPGVPDAYLFPPPPFKAVPVVPGRGGKVSILGGTQLPPMTPRDQNPYWQELDKRLGVTTDRTLVPLSSYPEKIAVVVASGDIPDLTLVRANVAPDLNKALQQGAFTDLTSYVTGDALNEYPNLAKYPDYTWKYAKTKDKLYGLPFQNYRFGSNMLMYRRDWAQKLGIPQPKNADEVYQLLVGMSKGDPDGNKSADTWGLGVSPPNNLLIPFIQSIFRVPNGWRLQDGKLINAIETDEFKQSLAFARKLWEGGAYHPDAATMTMTQMQDAIIGGKIGGVNASPQDPYSVRAPRDAAKQINPAADIRLLTPPGFDGGPAVAWNNTAVNGIVSIPAKVGKDKERVKELLRVADYHAATFGSEEWRFVAYGIENLHHTVQPNGVLVLNDRGRADISEISATLFPTRVLYFLTTNLTEDDARYVQGAAKDILAIGVDNPTWTAFSITNFTKAAELTQLANDRINGMVTGRDPLSALDTYIKDWRSRGGDQIRKEFEDDLKAQ